MKNSKLYKSMHQQKFPAVRYAATEHIKNYGAPKYEMVNFFTFVTPTKQGIESWNAAWKTWNLIHNIGVETFIILIAF